MAKDGTMRGGARVGSGRKSKGQTEKIDSGLAATVIDLPEPAEISGEDGFRDGNRNNYRWI
jgi:hypothetical protein